MKTLSVSIPLRIQLLRVLTVAGSLMMPALAQAQDAFEDDNTPGTAKPILNAVIQNRSLPFRDEDWATFTIGAAGATTLRIETAGAVGDTELWLYSADNLTKEIVYADDGATGKFSLITLGTVASGTYYIKVAGVGGSIIPSYVLRASWVDRADSFESDNTAAAARVIANGEVQERSIHVANDEDWAVFTVGNPGATDLQIETAGVIGDTVIFLFGPNNSTTQIATNDDFGTGKFSRINLSSLATGTYFIRVISFGQSSTISAYTLRASWTEGTITQPGDSFEPDDTPAAARTIANGQTQNRSIHVVGDVDWVRFVVGTNGATNVRVQTSGVAGDTEMWLYGPNSFTSQLDYNDDAGGGTFSQISRASLPAGTYYIKVGEFGGDRTIPSYALTVGWTESTPVPQGDSFESDDTPAAAKGIANGESQNRSIHVAGDVDWATFSIGANGASGIRLETAGSVGDTEMWLYGPNDPTNLVAYDSGASSGGFARLGVSALGPGTYFVRVTELGNNGTLSAYSLRALWTPGTPVAVSGGRLVNLSIRSTTSEAAPTIIVGFVTIGTGAKQFLLRGVGPTLGALGVTGALVDPTMKVYAGPNLLSQNDNWGAGGTLRAAATTVGAFQLPDNSRDAALLQTLGAGAYTVQVEGGNGVALVEAYEVGSNPATRLTNLSARAQVGTGGDVLIAGFVIGGEGARTVLVRAVGPGLGTFGVIGFLADPRLDVYRGTSLLQSNDNWGGGAALSAIFAQVGAFGLQANSRDAVLQLTLQPGAYSAQISGVGGTIGEALVEVYEVR